MLRYLTKFLLDIAPPVAATVIGAWIVTHYVAPKVDTAAAQKTEASASQAPASKQPLSGASGMSPRNVEQVAVKPTADEAGEAKKQDKPAVAEKPAARQAAVAPRAEEKREATRDAADLARAALDRLRSQAPAESHRPPVQASMQPAAVQPAAVPPVNAQPPATAMVPPPAPSPAAGPAPGALPPPIVVAPQREGAAPLFGETARPTPPADIPVRSADASVSPGEGRSLIGGIASAAKSLVDVVIPR